MWVCELALVWFFVLKLFVVFLQYRTKLHLKYNTFLASFISCKNSPSPGEAQETISSQQSEWQCQAGISLYIDCNCFSLLTRLSSHPSLFFPISGRFQLHKVIALRQPQLGFIVPAGHWVRHTSQLLFLRNKWPFRALIYGLPSQTLP